MGRRGPKPMPTEVAKAQGVYDPRYHKDVIPLSERASVVDMQPPDRLTPEARAAWLELVEPMRDSNVLQVTDGPALEMMAEALAEYRSAQDSVDRMRANGSLLYKVGTNGAWATAPEMTHRDKARDAFLKIAAKFGGTPSDRVALGLQVVKGRSLATSLADMIGERPSAGDVVSEQ